MKPGTPSVIEPSPLLSFFLLPLTRHPRIISYSTYIPDETRRGEASKLLLLRLLLLLRHCQAKGDEDVRPFVTVRWDATCATSGSSDSPCEASSLNLNLTK